MAHSFYRGARVEYWRAVNAPSAHPAAPPTTPEAAGVVPVQDRVVYLERRMKWLMLGLLGCAVLVVAMAGITGYVFTQHAALLAQQAAEEKLQLELLQQIRSDFDAMEQPAPSNPLEAYQQLRGYLNQLQGVYGAMGEFDVTDMDGSLDRMLEGFEEPATRTDERGSDVDQLPD
jgi:hypothetical protein